jgi:hypothetical protein
MSIRTLVVYTYYVSPSSDYNLSFFLKIEVQERPDVDYIIVVNGHLSETIQFPYYPNVKVIYRLNQGFDYGGHSAALMHIFSEHKSYDFYFFMNSGVFGPVLRDPSQKNWKILFQNKITDQVKLVGTTIVCLPESDLGGMGPKVEGFFFMTDAIGLDCMLQEKTIFCNHSSKDDAIIFGEYGMSRCIFRHGYTIDCMLQKYQGIDWRDPSNHFMNGQQHPSRHNSFYGQSIDPYEVIFHKWYWHGLPTVNFEVVDAYRQSQLAAIAS